MVQSIKFDSILEMLENLSIDEQNDLINIIRHRQIERRREEIANNIAIAHQEYQTGKVFRGTVDEILTELDND